MKPIYTEMNKQICVALLGQKRKNAFSKFVDEVKNKES